MQSYAVENYNAQPMPQGTVKPEQTFKGVHIEAMGLGLWTPHLSVIELTYDQSAAQSPGSWQNDYLSHKGG